MLGLREWVAIIIGWIVGLGVFVAFGLSWLVPIAAIGAAVVAFTLLA